MIPDDYPVVGAPCFSGWWFYSWFQRSRCSRRATPPTQPPAPGWDTPTSSSHRFLHPTYLHGFGPIRHYLRLLHYTFKSLDFLFPSGIVGKTDDHCVYTMSGSSVCAREALHRRLGQWVESLQGEGGGGARGWRETVPPDSPDDRTRQDFGEIHNIWMYYIF
jgi:hypothetical protein